MSCFDTCFFERYAHETLRRCLGSDFDGLVNRDRPDLQSPDGVSWGIEVTRAMEESKDAAEKLLDYMSGMMMDRSTGQNVQRYWSLALPMKRILENKVGKMTGGFYGDFQNSGLYVFCNDLLSDADVFVACHKVMDLQECCERKYDYLYLSEVSMLHVCNLSDSISDMYRVSEYPISTELRKDLYYSALDK